MRLRFRIGFALSVFVAIALVLVAAHRIAYSTCASPCYDSQCQASTQWCSGGATIRGYIFNDSYAAYACSANVTNGVSQSPALLYERVYEACTSTCTITYNMTPGTPAGEFLFDQYLTLPRFCMTTYPI